MKPLKINEPFWSAWKKYGWTPKVPGIGIKKELVQKALKNGGILYLTIAKDPQMYQIKATKVISLVNKHNSIYHARAGVTLYVIPQDELEKVLSDETSDSQENTG